MNTFKNCIRRGFSASMEQENQETACIVSDMSDMVVVDLHSAVKAEETEEGLPGAGRSLLDITQGLWKAVTVSFRH